MAKFDMVEALGNFPVMVAIIIMVILGLTLKLIIFPMTNPGRTSQ
jgi:hypothetical protein